MKYRCNNKNDSCYERYGGMGIKVCERWNGFKNFFEDMGERPEGLTLGRIDNNKGYNPSNCRWETREQQQNNCHHNKFITHHGKTLTASQWARETGISLGTIWNRIYNGEPPSRILTKGKLPFYFRNGKINRSKQANNILKTK